MTPQDHDVRTFLHCSIFSTSREGIWKTVAFNDIFKQKGQVLPSLLTGRKSGLRQFQVLAAGWTKAASQLGQTSEGLVAKGPSAM